MIKRKSIGQVDPSLAIILLIFLAVIIFSFASCTTEKKVQAWNDNHQEKASKYCADHWPPQGGDTIINVTIDSSEYTRAMSDLNETVYYLNEINDSLIREIAQGDTACSKYARTLQEQKNKIGQLQMAAREVKPKIITITSIKTVIDSALAVSLKLKNKRLETDAAAKDKDIGRLKGDKKTYTWMLISAGLLILLLMVLLFKKKSNPILGKL